MSQYSISIRGPYIWNSFLSSDKKQITTMHNLSYSKIEAALSREQTRIF